MIGSFMYWSFELINFNFLYFNLLMATTQNDDISADGKVITPSNLSSSHVKIESRAGHRKGQRKGAHVLQQVQQVYQNVQTMITHDTNLQFDSDAYTNTNPSQNSGAATARKTSIEQDNNQQAWSSVKRRIALPAKNFDVDLTDGSKVKGEYGDKSFDSANSGTMSPKTNSNSPRRTGPPNLSNKLQRHAANTQRMLAEQGNGYSPRGQVQALLNSDDPFAFKHDLKWKVSQDQNQEQIKRITKLSGPFMAHQIVASEQEMLLKKYQASTERNIDPSVMNAQSQTTSVLGSDANYKKDQQEHVSTSWNVLASALNHSYKAAVGDTTSTVTGESHSKELTGKMDQHMHQYFKTSGDDLTKTRNSIRGYLSKRFNQQRKAEDMRCIDQRNPSLNAEMYVPGKVPAAVMGNAYQFNLDCSKKVELGSSFRPPVDRQDDEFERTLDNVLEGASAGITKSDIKSSTFSAGFRNKSVGIQRHLPISKFVSRPTPSSQHDHSQWTQTPDPLLRSTMGARSFGRNAPSFFQAGATRKRGFSSAPRPVRHASSTRHKTECLLQKRSSAAVDADSAHHQKLFNGYMNRLRQQNQRQQLNDGFGGVALHLEQTRTDAVQFFEEQQEKCRDDDWEEGSTLEKPQALQDAEDQLKYGRMLRQETMTLRDVIKVPLQERSIDQHFFFRMHVKENIQFFSGYQGYVLQNICEKFEQKVFDRGDVIAHKGELNNKMVIMLFGKAAMYSDDQAKHLERELKPNQYFGEKALKETETNEYTIIATKVSMCLILAAEDFEENVFYLRHKEKMNRMAMLKTMDSFKFWEENRLRELNCNMVEETVYPGDVIYDIGARVDTLYIVKSGCASLECEIEIDEENRCPISQNQWLIKKVKRKIMFELTKFRSKQIFGHQELIEILHSEEKGDLDEHGRPYRTSIVRNCRVVASCQSQIICIGIDLFFRMFESRDIKKISTDNFNFVEPEAQLLVKTIQKNQRQVDFTVREAAKSNILASEGDGVFPISKVARDRKRTKMNDWYNLRDRKQSHRGNISTRHDRIEADEEQPKFRPVDMVKVLETRIEKQIQRRSPTGRMHFSEPQSTTTSCLNKRSAVKINLAQPSEMYDKKSNSDLSICPSVLSDL